MYNIQLERSQASVDTLGSAVPNADLLSSVYFAEHIPRPGDSEAISPYSVNAIAGFYAHALMEGGQATAAYEAFAEFLETRGEDAIAALFRRLAIAQLERASELFCRTVSLPLPQLPRWRFSWLYSAAPDQAAREMIAHLITPHAALTISLEAVSRARAQYERLSTTAGHSEVRTQARVLAAEKSRHAQWLGDTLAAVAAPLAWREDFDGLWPTS